MFRLQLGIPRSELEGMSVPEMLDHLDYWRELNSGD